MKRGQHVRPHRRRKPKNPGSYRAGRGVASQTSWGSSGKRFFIRRRPGSSLKKTTYERGGIVYDPSIRAPDQFDMDYEDNKAAKKRYLSARGRRKEYVPSDPRAKTYNARNARLAVMRKVVPDYAGEADTILDYGAGVHAPTTQYLRNLGFCCVVPYDLKENMREGLHNPHALSDGPYDVVFASNVLNVQYNKQQIWDVVMDAYRALRKGGIFLANYPASPRKAGLSSQEMLHHLNLLGRLGFEDITWKYKPYDGSIYKAVKL